MLAQHAMTLLSGLLPSLLFPAVVLAMQLPPEIQADRYLMQAKTAITEQDFRRAKTAMDTVLELQAQHDLKLPEWLSFRYAEVLEQLGLHDEAIKYVTEYLTVAGRDGKYYRAALKLLNKAEAEMATVVAARKRLEEKRKRVREAIAGMEFVRISAGEFLMGSTSPEAGDDEQPVTLVRISRAFDLGKYEVTQGQWNAIMGINPSYFVECGPNCPVENVSWNDVREFIARLNEYSEVAVYRLPTEAEWEYAARAGTSGDRYAETLDAIAWVRRKQWEEHEAGGREGTECVGPARHARERLGVGTGQARPLSGWFGDGPKGASVGLEASSSGRGQWPLRPWMPTIVSCRLDT